ncbi:MAG: cell envelope biogenesis protein TolA, partial [Methylocystis sp.]|nr:cell envelope biogenesis protein TolA [Methylocystis sp.]
MKVSRSEPGFVVSSAVHAGLLLAAFVVFSQPAKFEDAIETPVEVITDAEFTQTPKGEKTAHEKTPKPRVDKVEKDSGIKPNLPLNEAKKDTPAPLPPLRRTAEPGEDDAPRIPPKRVAALAPEPKAEPTKVEPKPAPKAEAKPEPKPEEKHEAKHAPQPAKPKSAAPEKHEDEPKEAEVIKPKPLKLERPDQAMP